MVIAMPDSERGTYLTSPLDLSMTAYRTRHATAQVVFAELDEGAVPSANDDQEQEPRDSRLLWDDYWAPETWGFGAREDSPDDDNELDYTPINPLDMDVHENSEEEEDGNHDFPGVEESEQYLELSPDSLVNDLMNDNLINDNDDHEADQDPSAANERAGRFRADYYCSNCSSSSSIETSRTRGVGHIYCAFCGEEAFIMQQTLVTSADSDSSSSGSDSDSSSSGSDSDYHSIFGDSSSDESDESADAASQSDIDIVSIPVNEDTQPAQPEAPTISTNDTENADTSATAESIEPSERPVTLAPISEFLASWTPPPDFLDQLFPSNMQEIIANLQTPIPQSQIPDSLNRVLQSYRDERGAENVPELERLVAYCPSLVVDTFGQASSDQGSSSSSSAPSSSSSTSAVGSPEASGSSSGHSPEMFVSPADLAAIAPVNYEAGWGRKRKREVDDEGVGR